MNAKEALLLSIRNSNDTISKFIFELEEEIKVQAKQGLRTCEGKIVIYKQLKEFDINISDVIEYFQIQEYIVSYERSETPFNMIITYNVKLEWEMKQSWIYEE